MKRGISQSEMARQLGWNQPRISDYYRGIKAPTDASVEAMAAVLDCSPAELSATFMQARKAKKAKDKAPDTEG
jgi:transcriptional regulator with XRE-family HTH domain